MNHKLFIGINGLAGSGKDTVAKMIRVILENKGKQLSECMQIYKEHFYNPWISATFSANQERKTENVFCIAFADQLKTVCSTIFGLPVIRFYQNKSTGWICINKDFTYTEIKPEDSQIITADDFYNSLSSFMVSDAEPIWMSLREILVYVGTYVLQQDINKRIFVNIVNNLIKQESYKNDKLEYVIVTDIRFLHEIDYIRSHNGITINVVRDSIQQLDNIAEHELDNENCWDYVVENNGTYEELFEKVYSIIYAYREFLNDTVDLKTHENVDNFLRCNECYETYDSDNLTYSELYELCTEHPIQSVAHTDGKISMINTVGGPSIFLNQPIETVATDKTLVPVRITIDEDTNKFLLLCNVICNTIK